NYVAVGVRAGAVVQAIEDRRGGLRGWVGRGVVRSLRRIGGGAQRRVGNALLTGEEEEGLSAELGADGRTEDAPAAEAGDAVRDAVQGKLRDKAHGIGGDDRRVLIDRVIGVGRDRIERDGQRMGGIAVVGEDRWAETAVLACDMNP